jgi:RNA polymerase sigma-70 factor (ECF subfamily)
MPACPDARRAALSAAVATDTARLHALAVRMLGDHHSAQDAVQDACLRALVSLDRYRGEASMATWLYRITANICLDELRRRKRITMEPASDKDDDWLPEADFSEGVAVRVELSGALDALPAGQRSALLLTDVLGYNYSEAGAVLGIPKGTVASRINRARRTVRTALGAAA